MEVLQKVVEINIRVGDEDFEGVLDDSKAPDTVAGIIDALPIEEFSNTWGDEIYFAIPVEVRRENAVSTVSVGDMAYWPEGHAFCIFYGKTPMSQNDDEIIPASPVNPVGTISSPDRLKTHRSGEKVRITLKESG